MISGSQYHTKPKPVGILVPLMALTDWLIVGGQLREKMRKHINKSQNTIRFVGKFDLHILPVTTLHKGDKHILLITVFL